MNGTSKNLTGFSYISEISHHLHRESKAAPRETSLTPPTGRSPSPTSWRSLEFVCLFVFPFLRQTPSLLACVSTTLSTGMNADVSLKLLLLTMWVWMLRPSV